MFLKGTSCCVMRSNFSVEWIRLTVLWQFSVKAPYGFLCYLNVAWQSNFSYAYTLCRLIAIAEYVLSSLRIGSGGKKLLFLQSIVLRWARLFDIFN